MTGLHVYELFVQCLFICNVYLMIFQVRDFRGWPASHSCFVPSLLKKDDNLYCCVADIQRSMYSIQRNELTCKLWFSR